MFRKFFKFPKPKNVKAFLMFWLIQVKSNYISVVNKQKVYKPRIFTYNTMTDFEKAVDHALGKISKGNVNVFMVKNPQVPGEPDKALDEIRKLLPYRRGVVYFSLADVIEDGKSYSHSCGYEPFLFESKGFLHPDNTWLDVKTARFLMQQDPALPDQDKFYIVPFMVYPSIEDMNRQAAEMDMAQIAEASHMMIDTFLVTEPSGTSVLPQVQKGKAGSYTVDWLRHKVHTSTESALESFSEKGFKNYVAARERIDSWVRHSKLD